MTEIKKPFEELFGSRRALPVLYSGEIAECGIVCLTMVAQYHGHDIDVNALRQRSGISSAGSTLRSLIKVADSLDLSSRAIRVDLSGLKNIKTPAVLHWDMNHFVVLSKINGDDFIIHDPNLGRRVYKREEISKHYTGVSLELTKSKRFQKQVERTPTRISSLWTTINGFWGSMAQVSILAIFLQVISLIGPFYMQLMVDSAVPSSDKAMALTLALAFMGVMCIRLLTSFFQSWTVTALGMMLSFQMVGNLVRHLLRLNVKYFESRHIGDILSRIESLSPIRTAFTTDAISVVLSAFMAVFSLSILFIYSLELTLIVIVAVVLEFIIQLAIYPYRRRLSEEQIQVSAKEQSFLMESIRASTTLKLMSFEAERESQWRNIFTKEMNVGFSMTKLGLYSDLLFGSISGIKSILIIYVAVIFIIDANGFSLGMLFAFTSYQGRFGSSISNLINKFIAYKLLSLHLDRVGDIVNAEPDSFIGNTLEYDSDASIRLEKLSFAYSPESGNVLENVSLSIDDGESICFVGPSGCGKTTLLKLLLGLYEPNAGKLYLGGREATNELLCAWRPVTASVMQNDSLLTGSIEQNIAFFDPQIDITRVKESARLACIDDEIEKMPMGYQSLIGDMGSALSGGQKQRILLARALYRKAKILFMDEGTANLDPKSEERIAETIQSLSITRVLVAHRPALIRGVDRVFMVKGGNVEQIDKTVFLKGNG